MTAQLCSSIAVGFVKSKSVNYSHLCVRSLPGTDGRSDHLRQHAPPQLCGVEDDVPFDNVGVRGIRIGADRDATRAVWEIHGVSLVSPRDSPLETELLVKGLGIERAVASCGEAGQLAEANASVDVVQIDTNEVGVGAEPFGHVDHFAQPSGLRGLAICPRRSAAERHVPPVGPEEVLRSSAEASGVDLYEGAFA